MFKSYLFRNSDPSIDMILCMTSFLLSCHHQRNSDTSKAANTYTKPLCTLCPTRALEPWIRRFTIFTDLVQREGNGEVKIQYRKAQAQRRSLAQPPPELGMALLRTVLSSAFYLLTWKNPQTRACNCWRVRGQTRPGTILVAIESKVAHTRTTGLKNSK